MPQAVIILENGSLIGCNFVAEYVAAVDELYPQRQRIRLSPSFKTHPFSPGLAFNLMHF